MQIRRASWPCTCEWTVVCFSGEELSSRGLFRNLCGPPSLFLTILLVPTYIYRQLWRRGVSLLSRAWNPSFCVTELLAFSVVAWSSLKQSWTSQRFKERGTGGSHGYFWSPPWPPREPDGVGIPQRDRAVEGFTGRLYGASNVGDIAPDANSQPAKDASSGNAVHLSIRRAFLFPSPRTLEEGAVFILILSVRKPRSHYIERHYIAHRAPLPSTPRNLLQV